MLGAKSTHKARSLNMFVAGCEFNRFNKALDILLVLTLAYHQHIGRVDNDIVLQSLCDYGCDPLRPFDSQRAPLL